MSRPFRALWAPVVLALLVVVVFGGAVRNGYVQWDDPVFVTGSPAVAYGVSWKGIRWAFEANLTQADTRVEYWIPVTVLSRLVDAELGGMSAAWVHGMSVLYHLGAAMWVWLALRWMGVGPLRSWVVAAVFALHPVQVEAVCWASGRKDVLGGLFWAATMAVYALYVRQPSRLRYAGLVGIFLAALMAKPSVLTLPAALLLLDLWPLRRWGREPALRLVVEKLPLALLSGVSLLMSVLSQIDHGGMKSLELYPLPVRLANAALAYVDYLRTFVWPAGLAPIYPHPGESVAWGRAAVAAATLAMVSLAAWSRLRKAPWFFVGWFCFLGTLVPMIGLVQLGGAARADRYLYSALIGLCFIAIETGARVVRALHPRIQPAVSMSLTAVGVALLGLLSARQVGLWRDTETLFGHTVRVTGPNRQAHLSLAIAAFARGDLTRARAEAERALAIHDAEIQAWILLGKVCLLERQIPQAIACFGAVTTLDPNDARGWFLLGRAREKSGDGPGAVTAYRRAAELRPDWGRPLAAAASVLEAAGDAVAAAELRAAAARRPVGEAEEVRP